MNWCSEGGQTVKSDHPLTNTIQTINTMFYERAHISLWCSEGGQTVKSVPPLTNTIQTGPSVGLGQVGAIRPGLPGRQLTATVSGLSSVDLPAQTGPRYRMEPRMGPNGTVGTNSQPGPTYGPHGTPGHFLYNYRPVIISFDSGLTPEIVTRSSPHGDVN